MKQTLWNEQFFLIKVCISLMGLLVDFDFLLHLAFGPLKNIYFYVFCHLDRVVSILCNHFLANVILVEPELLTCSFKRTFRFRLQFREDFLNSYLIHFLHFLLIARLNILVFLYYGVLAIVALMDSLCGHISDFASFFRLQHTGL
jgi:hypothetical protein